MRYLVALLCVSSTVAFAAEVIGFDQDKPGAAPAGWMVTMTHEGGQPKWEVVADPSAPSRPNALAQNSTDRTSGRFPLAILEKSSLADGSVSVRFKPVSGKTDQAAGLVWRYKDPNNYYIVRANALEDNVVLYKVENGKRSSLAPKGTASDTYGVKQKVPSGAWSSLGVTFKGRSFVVQFDGKTLFEVEDATFSGPGKVGLWTKADSVTYFDDFQYEGR
jgi:hypothetical protein